MYYAYYVKREKKRLIMRAVRSNSLLVSLLLGAVFLLAGCPKQPQAPIVTADGAIGPSSGVDLGTSFANEAAISQPDSYSAKKRNKLGRQIVDIIKSHDEKGNITYFAFDQYDLSTKAKTKLNKIADVLVKYPKQKVRITGNTDPIGSDDYNFTLGQKRADAVSNYLQSQGVGQNQVCTVSYGSSRQVVTPSDLKKAGCELKQNKPVATKACIKAYAKDRRAEIIFGKDCSGDKQKQ
jgi:peptidoglycan-associated lipoprotein